MAKVDGPLFSVEARGKIADAVVYFPWKGLHVVREWIKPLQPEDPKQGDNRLITGGLGRSTSVVQTGSLYRDDAIAVAPEHQTWVSRFVQYIRTNYMADIAAFDDEVGEFEGHDEKAKFISEAALLGLLDFDMTYKTTEELFAAGLMLYELGQYGCQQHLLDNEMFNRAPYTTAFADWASADIVLLVADIKVPV